MMPELEELLAEINNLRKLQYFLEHEKFLVLFNRTQDKTEIRSYIKSRDIAKVKIWIDNQHAEDYEAMSREQLIYAAQSAGIRKTYGFNKRQLVSLLLDWRRSENNRRPTADRPETREVKGGNS